jgi:hypothetical protein
MLGTLKKSIALVAICFPATVCEHRALADGALAVGVTGDVAKDGYSIGIVVNKDSPQQAREAALEWCRTHGSPKTRAHCKLISGFRRQCASEAYDPQPGTPGAGWAIAQDRETAEKMAMANCAATAGKTRQKFCKLAIETLCDDRP